MLTMHNCILVQKMFRNVLFLIIIALALAVGLDFLIYLFQGTNTAGLWYNKYWIGFFLRDFLYPRINDYTIRIYW